MIIHLEVSHIPKIVILAICLFSYKVIGKREKLKTGTEAESIAPSVSPTVTAEAKNYWLPLTVAFLC